RTTVYRFAIVSRRTASVLAIAALVALGLSAVVTSDPAAATVTGSCTESGLAPPVVLTCTVGSGTWTGPPGVTSVQLDAEGGAGALGRIKVGSGPGGFERLVPGGKVTGALPVTAGATYTVLVGGQGTTPNQGQTAPGGANGGGASGPNAGSGGGRSEIDAGSTRLVVAGGGGGGGAFIDGGGPGGAGGGTTGENGSDGTRPLGTGGGAGTQTDPGHGGGIVGLTSAGFPGTGSQGGAGGGADPRDNGGGGGGGGFFGGGGGGSGHVDASITSLTMRTGGGRQGDGTVTFTYAPSCGTPVASGSTATVTCAYTGAAQAWAVPAGVTSATFDVEGAQGGDSFAAGGLGGRSVATLAVTPGSTVFAFVGGAGAADSGGMTPSPGGFNGGGDGAFSCAAQQQGITCDSGGGGGGASDVRIGGSALSNRVI